jgi:hypothetical protein
MNEIAKVDDADPIEAAVAYGDLSKLTAEQRNRRYLAVCKSLGLNPLTRPIEYMVLSGKLTEYVTRAGADQLRMIHGISVEIVSRQLMGELMTVHTRAKTPDGRADEDYGVISLPDHIKADIRANMVMKAITKAKRRVTLSICGLGWLDETEVADIPTESKSAPPKEIETKTVSKDDLKARVMVRDAQSGSVSRLQSIDAKLAAAAEKGTLALQKAWDEVDWNALSDNEQTTIKATLFNQYQPRAIEVDAMIADNA